MPSRTNPAPGGCPPAPTLRLQVYQDLRRGIESGTLAPGSRLPPSRSLALELGVARNTVLWALERLRAEGFVEARVGSGSHVAAGLAALRGGRRPGSATAGIASHLVDAALSRRGRRIADSALLWQPPRVPAAPFRIGAPEVASFPFAQWERLARQAAAPQREAAAQYLDPAGLPELREAIAHWLWVSRGVRCDAGQILVTSGSQQGIDLVGRLLLDEGDEALVEDPGYPGIRACLLGHGAHVRPLPVDAQGLVIAGAARQWPAAKLAVVTPTHQFPTGVRMSLARRLELLAWARERQAWIVEDDYDGEFQYGAHRLDALCSLPHAERVIYLGTFSKTLHPGLRLGFLVLPHALMPAFTAGKTLLDRHAPGQLQQVLARFIADGHLLRHLRRMRELYAGRQALLIDALARSSRGALRLEPAAHGMHLLAETPGRDLPLASACAEVGVLLAPLSRYAIESPRQGWLFGYAAYDDAALREAARRVGPLLKRHAG